MQQNIVSSVTLVNFPINVDNQNASLVPMEKHQRAKVKRIVHNVKQGNT